MNTKNDELKEYNPQFDPLVEAIETSTTLFGSAKKYILALESSEDPRDLSHSFKIKEFIRSLSNKQFISSSRRIFNQIYEMIDRDFPEILFNITGRRKSFLSFERKIREVKRNNKSLDTIRDLFAFRILILNQDPEKAAEECYNVALKVVSLFIKSGFILCEAEPLKDTGNLKKDFSGIYIPEKSGIPEKFAFGFKDYIRSPKENGYQSVHFVVRSKSGECIEIQVRSFAMHLHAEHGNASHSEYKKNSSCNEILLDPKKIKMEGFGISGEDIIDFIGLIYHLVLFARSKTFSSKH